MFSRWIYALICLKNVLIRIKEEISLFWRQLKQKALEIYFDTCRTKLMLNTSLPREKNGDCFGEKKEFVGAVSILWGVFTCMAHPP